MLNNANIVDNAPDRRSAGTCAATAAADAGSAHPLAAPNKNRAATTASTGAVVIELSGVTATAIDHTHSPPSNTFAPPNRSLDAPAASCVTPYPHRNALCASAKSFMDMPSSAFRLSAAAAKIVRSALASSMATPRARMILFASSASRGAAAVARARSGTARG